MAIEINLTPDQIRSFLRKGYFHIKVKFPDTLGKLLLEDHSEHPPAINLREFQGLTTFPVQFRGQKYPTLKTLEDWLASNPPPYGLFWVVEETLMEGEPFYFVVTKDERNRVIERQVIHLEP